MKGLALVVVLAACSTSDTRVHLEVTADPSWTIDSYQLRMGEHSAIAQPLAVIDLVVPDAMAGQQASLDVWGLAAGQQVAIGMVAMTPELHSTVTVAVTLNAVNCGTFCIEDSVECSGDGTSTCVMQSNGCLAWSTATPCPSDAPFCSNGACAATCTDDCAIGQTECDSSAATRICGQYDSDSCLDWSPTMACDSGQTCADGACATVVTCANNGDSCDDGNACTTNDTCESGACAGTAKCSAPANAESTCAADGACGFTCHIGYVASGTTCVHAVIAQMPTARAGLGVTLGPDSLIYAVGGEQDIGGDPVATVEAYNPSTNTWTTRASMPTARSHLAVAVGADHLIYAIGGIDAANKYLANVEAYNPSTNTWTTRTPMPTSRYGVATTQGADGLIYAIGGYGNTGRIATVEAYNPSTDTWTTRATMPTARSGLAAVLCSDGLIYAIGGSSGPGDTLATVEAYDPATDAWITRTGMPTARESFAATVGSDNVIYAVGGDHGIGASTEVVVATVEAFHPATNTWTTETSMTGPRELLGAASAGGLIFAIGGDTGVPILNTVEAYSSTSNTWW